MILDGKTLTPTELIRLHIMLETEDVRDDDTLRLVSIAVSQVAPPPRPTAAQTAAAQMPGYVEGHVGVLEGSLLARALWDGRMVET